MHIVDAHMHLGEDLMFLTDDSEEIVLKAMDDNGIAAQILMPGIVSRDQKKAHQRIRRFADAHPGRAFGVAVFNPLMDEGEYRDLVRWTVRDLGFKGVKHHPYAFCLAPTHPAVDKVFRVAKELDIVVMIHTGNGLPIALPSACVPAARAYPDVRIVLAHAGGGTFGADAIVAAQECPNIFLETSWVTSYDLRAMVEKLGPKRVMLGTDLISNMPVELAKYRAIGLSENELQWCLGKTAESVFRLA